MTEKPHSIELSIGQVKLSVTGSEEFVKDQFYSLHEKHGMEELEVNGATIEEETSKIDGDISGDENDSNPEIEKSLNEILADSNISTVKDKALVVGWYLESARGQDDFSRDEVRSEAQSSKVTLGKNVGRDIGYQVEDGHLGTGEERDGEETYWVTHTGLEYLRENGIPA